MIINIQVARKNYEIFASVWHDCGFTWDDMVQWMDEKMVPAMQIIHVEVILIIITTSQLYKYIRSTMH